MVSDSRTHIRNNRDYSNAVITYTLLTGEDIELSDTQLSEALDDFLSHHSCPLSNLDNDFMKKVC